MFLYNYLNEILNPEMIEKNDIQNQNNQYFTAEAKLAHISHWHEPLTFLALDLACHSQFASLNRLQEA